jgi:hypothetical protein
VHDLGRFNRSTLSVPTLLSAPAGKIILQGQLADLRVQLLQVNRRRGRRLGIEHVGRLIQQLVLPIPLFKIPAPPLFLVPIQEQSGDR